MVLITGAAGGIGLQMVETFAGAGAEIIACARKQESEFERQMDSLALKHAITIHRLYIDLENDFEIKRGMDELASKGLRIDVLVNNAGFLSTSLVGMTPLVEFKKSFQVNFLSAVQITQFAVKNMLRRRHGVIINIGSVAGLEGFSGCGSYGAAKAALMHFTKVAASEYGPNGVRVNAIAPSLVATRMAQDVGEKGSSVISARSALPRVANPSEICDLALFLASDKSSFINGQIIRIDGGM